MPALMKMRVLRVHEVLRLKVRDVVEWGHGSLLVKRRAIKGGITVQLVRSWWGLRRIHAGGPPLIAIAFQSIW